MTWLRIDDHYGSHPKLFTAGPLALALDITGMCYSSLHLTDGFVPDLIVESLTSMSRIQVTRSVAKLVEVGRWTRGDGGWNIHDFTEFNPSGEGVKERRRRDAERHRVRRSSQRTPSGLPAESQDRPSGIPAPRTPAPSPAPEDPSNMYIPYKDVGLKNGQEDADGIPGRDTEADSPNSRQAEVDRFADERASNRRRRRVDREA